MHNPIFDFDNGDYIFPTSDTMGMDSDGDIYMRMNDNTCIDMDTGDIHFTSGWDDEDEDD